MARVGTPVAVALGSNLGDRAAHLRTAIDALHGILDDIVVSPIVETDPVDTPDPQVRYLNAVLIGSSAAEALALLHALQRIEATHGRTRPYRFAPRTLDLDLVLYGDLVVDTPELTLPHPRFRDRRFVVGLLAEIAPAWRDPVTGCTMTELAARCPR